MLTDDEERAWIVGTTAGNESAFEQLFHRYYTPLCHFARTMVSEDVAEDVVQGLFVAIWDLGPRWDVRGSLRVYLYGAIRKRILDLLRAGRVRERHAADVRMASESAVSVAHDLPGASLEHDELLDVVQRAIQCLPRGSRQVFELHRMHGMTYDEIAAALDLSPKTVGVHMTRALAALLKTVGAYLAAALLCLHTLS